MDSTNSPVLLDIAHADIVLQSSDGQNFPMYKIDLARASPVFETMFALPQPAGLSTETTASHIHGLPIIHVSETADILNVLLQFCLPRSRPVTRLVEDLWLTARVLEGARKYEMEHAAEAACDALKSMAQREPLRVYATACLLGVESLARTAALRCLHVPLDTLVLSEAADAEGLSALELRRLLKYRVDCRDAAARYMGTLRPSGGSSSIWVCTCTHRGQPYDTTFSGYYYFPRWWKGYVGDITAKLVGCTWEGMVEKDAVMQIFLRSGSCQKCGTVASEDIDRFVRGTTEGIRREIANVCSSPSPISLARLTRFILSGRPRICAAPRIAFTSAYYYDLGSPCMAACSMGGIVVCHRS